MSSTQLKRDELIKLTDEEYACGTCGNKSFLGEVYECKTCAPRGQTGVRATLFDVDLKVMLSPGGNNNSKVLQVSGWSAPHPIAPEFVEAAKPLDLVARYAPMALEQQASLFGVVPDVPMQPQQPAPGQQFQRQPQTGGQQFQRQPQTGGQQQHALQMQPPPQQHAPQRQQPQQTYQPQPEQQPTPQFANPYGPKPAQ
jgi:hypothetical protein